jgi:hypothetical protein
MICSAKPVLTEDLCLGQKEEFSVTCYVRNILLTKGQAYSLETNPSSRQRGCYIGSMTASFELKKISGRELKGPDAKTN